MFEREVSPPSGPLEPGQILAGSPRKAPSRTLGLVPGPIAPTIPSSHPQQRVTRLITEISREKAGMWSQKTAVGAPAQLLGSL